MENWKDIKGYEGLYQISDLGRVKSLRRNAILRAGKSNTGYRIVALCKRGKAITKSVHRLVAEYFVDNPYNKPQVNHIDGDKVNNIYANIEWVTASENHIHAISIGLIKFDYMRGEKNHKTSLSESDVIKIKKGLKDKVSGVVLGKRYNVTRATIADINVGKTWGHVK